MGGRRVLVTGAGGYVGARLVARLLAGGYAVRAAGRSAARLSLRPWAGDPRVEIVEADVLDPPSLGRACPGCDALFYLVHSMEPGRGDFAVADREGARNAARAAASAGVGRIVYLGGLPDRGGRASEHLRSRDEVGAILAQGPVPVTWLRAAMILGAGSGSFEILRYLVDRLPVMVTPRWVRTESQPIGIRNVLDYLAGCLDVPETSGGTFDIGGPEVISYRRLMDLYAEEARLPKRLIIPVPVLSPRLSAYWIDFVTPAPASLARPLAEGLGARLVCGDDRIRSLIPVPLVGCREAIRAAVRSGGRSAVADAVPGEPLPFAPEEGILPGDPPWCGGTFYEDRRRVVVAAGADEAWAPLARIGGATGWYYGDGLWRLRGALDRLAGGVGMRRGRRDPASLSPGDPVDSWRVAAVVPGRFLRLVAEMKVPGVAVLEFRLRPAGEGLTEIEQVTRFVPRGLAGLLYRKAVDPLHRLVFGGMIGGLARATGKRIVAGPERLEGPAPPAAPARRAVA